MARARGRRKPPRFCLIAWAYSSSTDKTLLSNQRPKSHYSARTLQLSWVSLRVTQALRAIQHSYTRAERRNAQRHKPAATAAPAHDRATGRFNGPTSNDHPLSRRSTCTTATTPKMLPENQRYVRQVMFHLLPSQDPMPRSNSHSVAVEGGPPHRRPPSGTFVHADQAARRADSSGSFTVNTGQGASRTTFSATEPRSRWLIPLRP